MPQERDIEERIERLLSQMTLAEKIGQLNQVPNSQNLDHDSIRAGSVGSVLCATNPTAGNVAQERVFASYLNELQHLAVEESRLGIPLLFGRDVIHGHRTVAPIPLGQACAWDPGLVERASADAAREARADGLNWTFTPMLDIARDPRWGRIAEGYGEDPFLASQMARSAVRGLQGSDLSDPQRIAACAKHYVGYGAAEGGRDYNTTEITPATLRNVYLPPFKAAVEAGVASVMSAFHEIGGIPSTANRHLLREVLKNEWGFEGMVVSDWASVDELVQHGVAEDRAQAARLALEAGLDMDMVSEVYIQELASLVERGAVGEELLDDAVRRVLRLKLRLGLFERPYTDEALARTVHLRDDHRRNALELAKASVVLLSNREDLLPLPVRGKTLGVFGSMSDVQSQLFGTWTLDGQKDDVVSIVSAMRERFGRVEHAVLADDCVSRARFCDVVVAVVGESPGRSGEDNSTQSLELPPGQQTFLEALAAVGKPLVVVVVAGRPLAIEWIMDHADAVVWAFHPGGEGGTAIASILVGESSPSGRLPVTFPRSVGQVPLYYSHKSTGRPDPPAGRYIDGSDQPLLPFGFGLAYTRFGYSRLEIEGGDRLRCAASVRNTGDRPGEEVVQLYVRDLVGSITRPAKELRGFEKVALDPGEEKVVSFELGEEDLGFYLPDERFVVEPGRFLLWIGPNAKEGLEGSFEYREGRFHPGDPVPHR
ncbi:MAG TPA: glycoside hydrolase family 3 N-terminal domain-containing protein [Fimbriimonas sp.]